MLRAAVHMILHFIIPGVVAKWRYADRWKTAWLVMSGTMIVDLDHLLAVPVYDPNRCGIGFHPLHSHPAIVLFLLLALISRTRLIALGLIIHMLIDGLDCIWAGKASLLWAGA